MLPESNPNRIVATRLLSCFNCSCPIPPGITCYNVANSAWCEECYRKREAKPDDSEMDFGDFDFTIDPIK